MCLWFSITVWKFEGFVEIVVEDGDAGWYFQKEEEGAGVDYQNSTRKEDSQPDFKQAFETWISQKKKDALLIFHIVFYFKQISNGTILIYLENWMENF